jgi:hypothetical protein
VGLFQVCAAIFLLPISFCLLPLFRFVFWCVQDGYLEEGDIFIVDNASVHCGQEVLLLIDNLLKAARVKLVFLPTYSPECNPCELCFNFIKCELRTYRDTTQPMWLQLGSATALITNEHMHKFYAKCLEI